jgi:hypothetical protein
MLGQAGFVVSLAFLAVSATHAEPRVACDASRAALTEYFLPQKLPYSLERMGNSQRVKLMTRMVGDCLTRAYTKSDDPCGWAGVDKEGRPHPAAPPARETVAAFLTAPTQDATIACPMLVRTMRASPAWRKSSGHRHRRRRDGLYPYTYVGMTLPVLVESRGEAIAWVESQSGPLAGGSNLLLLRRRGGGAWEVAAIYPISVS